MGCCSSSKALTVKSPTSNTSIPNEIACQKESVIQQNTEKVNPQQLQQHHDINQGQSESGEDELPKSFANNQSIVQEVMRLEKTDQKINMENKSDENSEDTQLISNNNNESFAELPSNVINTNCNDIVIDNNIEVEDSYHPFGFIQTETEEMEKHPIVVDNTQHEHQQNERETVMSLEELYAENLKQHGFDANKFRVANTSVAEQYDNKQKTVSADLSSFGSSNLSSKSNINKTSIDGDYMENINNFVSEADEGDDLILEELSRSYTSDKVMNGNDKSSYIQNFKQSIKTTHKINNIMDDQDEQLMDAILSLDLAE